MHESAFPVFSVWLANQTEVAPPVDQNLGPEQGMVLARDDAVVIRPMNRALFDFVAAIREALTLGEAMDAAHLDEPGLVDALRFVFSEGLVVELIQRSKR
jgi:hypothetical protein